MAADQYAKWDSEEEGCPPTKKRKRGSKERNPDLTQQIHAETSYYVQNDLRFVVPYYFTFTSYAKRRWVGSTVYDVLCREFQAEQPEYYERAIKAGKVTVNGTMVTMETVLKDNDLLCHRVHRHEPPVSAQPVEVVHEDGDILVVNKPSSIPVHPCGRYRHNTMVFILSKELGRNDLRTSHRLDRLTSGLLIFAKNLGAAQKIEAEIRERKVSKEYVCRVVGEFPETPVECGQPILVVCKKLGVCKVDPAGKPCSTTFTRISYNGTSSVVMCTPRTGRMHQIRVHLQWLGHPIVNDPLYNNTAWGPKCGALGKGTENMDQVIQEITALNYSGELQTALDHKPAALSEDSGGVTEGRSDATIAGSHRSGPGGMTCGSSTAESSSVTSVSDERGPLVGCSGQVKVAQSLLDGGIETVSEIDPPPSSSADPTPLATDPTPKPITDPTPKPTTDPTPKPITDPTSTLVTNPTPKPITDPTPTPATGPTPPSGTADAAPPCTVDPTCTECAVRRPDPEPKDLVMYLHAVSYKGPNWEYRTDLPYWASNDFCEYTQPIQN